MILRAVFWIAVIAVLMPKEPDLGLGRPGFNMSTASALWAHVTSAASSAQQAQGPAALGALGSMQGVAIQSLAQVKAEIEEAKRQRQAAR